MYWPKEGVETYGVIQVKLVSEDVRATYTIRTFNIRHLKVFNQKLTSCRMCAMNFLYLGKKEEISKQRACCAPISLHQLARSRNT